MSDSVIFDSAACVKRMTKAGVEPHVAEAWATEQVNILEQHIATKTDIELLRKDTQITITQLETKLIRWVVGVGVGLGLTLSSIIVGSVFAAYQMLSP